MSENGAKGGEGNVEARRTPAEEKEKKALKSLGRASWKEAEKNQPEDRVQLRRKINEWMEGERQREYQQGKEGQTARQPPKHHHEASPSPPQSKPSKPSKSKKLFLHVALAHPQRVIQNPDFLYVIRWSVPRHVSLSLSLSSPTGYKERIRLGCCW